MKKNYLLLILLLLFMFPSAAGAVDFFLITNQSFSVEEQGREKTSYEYLSNLLVGIEYYFNDFWDLYLSAGFTFGWKGISPYPIEHSRNELSKELTYVPELLRTEFTRLNKNMVFRFGRINYSDPLGIIASGLFDGFQFSHSSIAGNFSIGAWYTGFLYKKTSYIVMNDRDLIEFNKTLDYGNFVDTYFSPRRLLMSLDWYHPSIADFFKLSAAVTAQIDFPKNAKQDDKQEASSNITNEKFHSQYLTLKAIIPIKSFDFELGGSIETSQKILPDVNTENGIALAGIVNIFYKIPTKFDSSLSLTSRFATGDKNNVNAFIPLSNRFYGDIFKTRMSGSSLISLAYTARFITDIGMTFGVSHFLRHDLVSYTAYPFKTDDNKSLKDEYRSGRSMGTEIFTKFVWNTAIDSQIILGGGVFLPVLGNAAKNAKPLWSVEIAMVFAAF